MESAASRDEYSERRAVRKLVSCCFVCCSSLLVLPVATIIAELKEVGVGWGLVNQTYT